LKPRGEWSRNPQIATFELLLKSLLQRLESARRLAVSDLYASYPVLGRQRGVSPAILPFPMTRHDFEAWLDHLDQAVLVEWRELDGGLVTDMTSMTGALRKDGEGEYHAGEAHIDLGDFEAADFGGDGVVVELAQENAELYIAVS
jgi:hypothetical protein